MHRTRLLALLFVGATSVVCENFTITQKFGPIQASDNDYVFPLGDAIMLLQYSSGVYNGTIFPASPSSPAINVTLELGPAGTSLDGFRFVYGAGAVYFTNKAPPGSTTMIYSEFCNSTGCFPQPPFSVPGADSLNYQITVNSAQFEFVAYSPFGDTDYFWVGFGIDELLSKATLTKVTPSLFPAYPTVINVMLSETGTSILAAYVPHGETTQLLFSGPFDASTNLTDFFQLGFTNDFGAKFNCNNYGFRDYSFSSGDLFAFIECFRQPEEADVFIVLKWPKGVAFNDSSALAEFALPQTVNFVKMAVVKGVPLVVWVDRLDGVARLYATSTGIPDFRLFNGSAIFLGSFPASVEESLAYDYDFTMGADFRNGPLSLAWASSETDLWLAGCSTDKTEIAFGSVALNGTLQSGKPTFVATQKTKQLLSTAMMLNATAGIYGFLAQFNAASASGPHSILLAVCLCLLVVRWLK